MRTLSLVWIKTWRPKKGSNTTLNDTQTIDNEHHLELASLVEGAVKEGEQALHIRTLMRSFGPSIPHAATRLKPNRAKCVSRCVGNDANLM
jgi:hypothetical protein